MDAEVRVNKEHKAPLEQRAPKVAVATKEARACRVRRVRLESRAHRVAVERQVHKACRALKET